MDGDDERGQHVGAVGAVRGEPDISHRPTRPARTTVIGSAGRRARVSSPISPDGSPSSAVKGRKREPGGQAGRSREDA